MSRDGVELKCCSECGTVLDNGSSALELDDLVLNRVLQRVTWQDHAVRLTGQQFEILELLAQRAGRVVQRWAFFINVLDEECEDNQLAVIISKIRKAFRAVDPEFDRLETFWGSGFRWRREGQTPLCNYMEKSLIS